MGHHDHGPAVVGETAQGPHHRLVHPGVQAGGGFVEEQQGRAGEQFQGHARTFALPTGQRADPLVRLAGETQFRDHLVDPAVTVPGGGVGGEPQFGGVAQGTAYGQLRVQDVVLWYEPDALA
ncbi:hypothetical protein GCM10029964_071670 [Kibdelosporangium lantanae]